ncbi:MAG: DUF481 domain-containing protein [Planctomycetota bacterium]
MRNGVSYGVICAVVLAVSTSAMGGQVYLKNGDQLTGTITTMADGKITIETALAGTVEVAMENVQTIRSDEPLELHLKDETVVKQPVKKGADGMIKVAGGGVIESQTVALADITTINPPKPEPPRWKGDISASATYESGNTNSKSYGFNANLSKRTEKDRTTLKAELVNEEEEVDGIDTTTDDWWKFSGKYDYFLNEKTYVFGQGIYESDKIAELDRRVILGGGAGRQWIEKETQNFSTEIGLASVYERYNTETDSDTKMSLLLGYHYDQQFNKTFSFIHDLTYFPSTEDFSDYLITSSAELRAKINGHLFANFRVLFDYDATPAAGEGSTDTKYIFGIGVNF